jgi:hypothetical protein
MDGGRRYAIDTARIVSEIIDGEAVVIDLANGYYYSLDPTATAIWEAIQSGQSVPRIVSALRRRYDCSGVDPEPATLEFLAQLSADDLIAPDPSPGASPDLDTSATVDDPREAVPFRAPTLQRFTDMQHFLLVDPIHEVDDRGWPHARPGEGRP